MVPINQPLPQFVTREKLDTRYLANFKMTATDHIERPILYDSQSTCRQQLAGAARTLQFLDATGMTPVKGGAKFYPDNDYRNDIPGSDHTSFWLHSPSKTRVIADEPYLNSLSQYASEEEAFEHRHGYSIQYPIWPGMYNIEGGCRLRLVFKHAANEILSPILERLNQIPVVSHDDAWQGTSTNSIERFISPAKKLAKANKPGKPKLAEADQPRYTNPNGNMSFDSHRKIGKAISDVLIIGDLRAGIHNPLMIVRNELDNWLMAQSGSEVLNNTELTQVYLHFYRSALQRRISESDRKLIITKLEMVDALLAKSYEEGRSLKRIRMLLRSAIRSATRWI